MKENVAKTCSNSPGLRMLFFILPVLMYNFWRIARFKIEVVELKIYSGESSRLTGSFASASDGRPD